MSKKISYWLEIFLLASVLLSCISMDKEGVTKNFEPEMVKIKGGCFMMGSPESEAERDRDEKQHEVCIKDFQIGKYEVTQAQWQAVMGNNPSAFKGDNLPVETVSWNDAQEFLERLNAKTGKNYRLPTEAEWEYAARAGTTTPYYWGDSIECNQANYHGFSVIKCNSNGTKSVGSYSPNPWGLYDMVGNVDEWSCSAYARVYNGSENQCVDSGDELVFRGGSWDTDGRSVRSAHRAGTLDHDRSKSIGFRIVLGL